MPAVFLCANARCFILSVYDLYGTRVPDHIIAQAYLRADWSKCCSPAAFAILTAENRRPFSCLRQEKGFFPEVVWGAYYPRDKRFTPSSRVLVGKDSHFQTPRASFGHNSVHLSGRMGHHRSAWDENQEPVGT